MEGLGWCALEVQAGLAEAISQLKCPEPALVCIVKVEEEYEQWCSPAPLSQNVPVALPPFGNILGWGLLYPSCSCKHRFFPMSQGR